MLKRIRHFVIPFLALLGVSTALAKGPEQQLGIYDFSKGLDSFHSSLSLPDGFVQDAQNVYFDRGAPVEKRQGYTVAFSTQSFSYQSAWSFTDSTNTSWIIVRSSSQITASNLAGTIVKIATTSANDLVGEVNSQGNAYFVDPTQGVYYWNGSTTAYVANSPKGSLITQFHGRIWVAGVAVPNGNQLYGSKYLDGTTWSIGVNPNDPVQLTVGLSDNFDNISAIYPFLDTLYVTKHYSISALYGFDQTSFQISFITTECGCIDQQSIQTFNHGLYFMSLRGVEFFNGYTCTRVSDPIKNKVDVAIQSQGGFQTQSWVQSQTTDWTSGTLSPSSNLSTTLAPPSLLLSTGVFVDSTSASFNLGSPVNTMTTNNQVSMSISNADPVNGNFEQGNFNGWGQGGQAAGLVSSPQVGNNCTTSAHTGTYFTEYQQLVNGFTTRIQANHCSDNSRLSSVSYSQAGNSCNWQQRSIPMSGLANKCVYIVVQDITNNRTILQSTTFYASGTDITFYVASDNLPPSAFGAVFFDDFTDGHNTISSGTFTSRTMDTTLTQSHLFPTWTTTSTDFTPTFVLQNSSDGSTWSNVADLSGGSGSDETVSRYVRYISTFQPTGTQDASSTLSNVSFVFTASSGVLTSQSHALGNIFSFGNFSVQDVLNSGNLAFTICSSANSNMVPSTCATQTPNAQITIATGAFVNVVATFTVTGSTQAPTLNSFTVQWFTGSRATSMASTIWDNRYYLAFSTVSTDNFNDTVGVLTTNNVWSVFDIKAGGFTQYKGNLYHSDSTATGNVYLDNQGYNDNGVAINAYIKTKDFSMGNLTEDDYIDSIWPSMDSLGSFNVSASYFVDRSTTTYPLGTMSQNEFATNASVKLPFPLDANHQNFGKTLAYKFQASDVSEPWKFYGFREIFHSRPTQ